MINPENKLQTKIGTLANALQGILIVAAFALSYNAVRLTAVSHGVNLYLSFVVPFVIDFPILIFLVNRVRSILDGEQGTADRNRLLFYTAVSVLFNLGHAHDPNAQSFIAGFSFFGAVMAFLWPLSLYIGSESLAHQLIKHVRVQKTYTNLNAILEQIRTAEAEHKEKLRTFEEERAERSREFESEHARRTTELEKLNKQIEQARTTLREHRVERRDSERPKANERQELILEFVRTNEHSSLAEIVRETGVPKSTAHGILSRLVDEGTMIKNGGYKLK